MDNEISAMWKIIFKSDENHLSIFTVKNRETYKLNIYLLYSEYGISFSLFLYPQIKFKTYVSKFCITYCSSLAALSSKIIVTF